MKIEKFEGDFFWNADDTEEGIYDPDDEMDNMQVGDIVEFQQAKQLSNFFGVAGKDSKNEYFTTRSEAEAYSIEVLKP